MRVEGVAEILEGSLHLRDPAAGQAVRSQRIEGGDDIPLQQIVERLRFHLILLARILVGFAVADGPADQLGVRAGRSPSFVPPAVQRAQVERAVGRGFHAAGAAGFERPQGRVEPDIAALHQVAADGHILIFQKDHVTAEFRIPRQSDNSLDQFLAAPIAGVRFAGEDNLHRPLGVAKDTLQPVGIP